MAGFLKRLFGVTENMNGRTIPSSVLLRDEAVANEPVSEPVIPEVTTPVVESTAPETIAVAPVEPQQPILPYQLPSPDIFDPPLDEVLRQFKEEGNGMSLPIIWSWQEGQLVVKDLAEVRSILVTGTQQTGKTCFLHQLVCSILMSGEPASVKLVLMEAKGVEFFMYRPLGETFLAGMQDKKGVVAEGLTDAVNFLAGLTTLMDLRFEMFRQTSTRNISEYYKKPLDTEKLPYIVVILDNLSAYTNRGGQELVPHLQRLVSDGYKAGIFFIIGTGQTVGRDLPASLLGLIDTRVVFRLNAREDYRKFFDTVKVDIALDQGHFRYAENGRIMKGQGVFFPLPSLQALVAFIAAQRIAKTPLRLPQDIAADFEIYDTDPLFGDAARIVVQNQMGSTSLLQRRLKLGYNRAGLLMDQLELAGVVGPNLGVKAREVLIKTERELAEVLNGLGL